MQGCGGNCNVLKEIMDPVGGKIEIRDIVCGDDTMSVLELWGAEYQVCPLVLYYSQALNASPPRNHCTFL